MAKKEFRVPFTRLMDPHTITQVNLHEFEKHGVGMRRNECDIEDDHDRGERIYKVQKNKTFIFLGGK